MTRDEREPTAREGGMAETRVEWVVQARPRDTIDEWQVWSRPLRSLDEAIRRRNDDAASFGGADLRIIRRTITEEVVP